MVEKIMITPEKVRGYGNIISPKTGADFTVNDCTLIVDTDTVNGELVTVYDLQPSATVLTVVLAVDDNSVLIGESVTLSATVKDGMTNPVSGASVSFKLNGASIGTSTTNSSGIATYTYTCNTAGTLTFSASCMGNNSNNVNVTVTGHDYSLTFSSTSYNADNLGNATVSALLTDNGTAVSGATVTFTGGTSTVTATTNSSGVATATVNFTADGTLTATSNGVSDTCSIVLSSYIYQSDMTSDDGYWITSGGNRTVTYSSNGCKVVGTATSDGFYKLDESQVTIPSTFYVEFDITEATQGAYSESTDFVVGNISVRKQSNQLYIGQLSGGTNYTGTFPSYPVHIRIEFDTTVKAYVNGTLLGRTWTGSYQYIGFKTYSQRSMTVKNVEIGALDDEFSNIIE